MPSCNKKRRSRSRRSRPRRSCDADIPFEYKECAPGERLIQPYYRNCPYRKLVKAYCRRDPNLVAIVDHYKELVSRYGSTVEDAYAIIKGVSSYIEMLMIQWYYVNSQFAYSFSNSQKLMKEEKEDDRVTDDVEKTISLIRRGLFVFHARKCDKEGNVSSVGMIVPPELAALLQKDLQDPSKLSAVDYIVTVYEADSDDAKKLIEREIKFDKALKAVEHFPIIMVEGIECKKDAQTAVYEVLKKITDDSGWKKDNPKYSRLL